MNEIELFEDMQARGMYAVVSTGYHKMTNEELASIALEAIYQLDESQENRALEEYYDRYVAE